MVTGSRDPLLAREALELGALAYIDKPFDFAYLKRVVAMTLRPRSPTQTITQGPNQSPPRHLPHKTTSVANS